MSNKSEIANEISTLNGEIKELNYRKNEYQRVNREISSAISDFEDVKKSMAKAQGYLRESDTSDVVIKKAAEIDNDMDEVKGIISSLEEMQKETYNEIRTIDNQVMEKESQIRKLNIEMEEERRDKRK